MHREKKKEEENNNNKAYQDNKSKLFTKDQRKEKGSDYSDESQTIII